MKKTINLILVSLMMVLMAGIATAIFTCQIISPATSSVLKGDVTNMINISASGDANETLTNCTAIGISALTGDTITIFLRNNTLTANNMNFTYANISNTTLPRVDASDWAWSATCNNITTGTVTCTGTTGVIIDNTKPVYSGYSPSDGSQDTDGTVDFSLTCSNATSATLYIEDKSYAMAESSDVCTATVSDLRNSIQSWYVIGNDGLNTTTSSTTTVEIRKSGGGIVQNGQLTVGASQSSQAQPSKSKELINSIVSIPMKIINAIISAFMNVFTSFVK